MSEEENGYLEKEKKHYAKTCEEKKEPLNEKGKKREDYHRKKGPVKVRWLATQYSQAREEVQTKGPKKSIIRRGLRGAGSRQTRAGVNHFLFVVSLSKLKKERGGSSKHLLRDQGLG